MFSDHVRYEARARFLRNIVCDMPEWVYDACAAIDAQAAPGLRAYRAMLCDIYDDAPRYAAGEALESYHNLTYTALFFLYALAREGELREAQGVPCLKLDKKRFLAAYKKGLTQPFEWLTAYGVRFAYEKAGKSVASLRACDAFTVVFERAPEIARALKLASRSFAGVDLKREYGDAMNMLGRADWRRLILQESALRERVDALRPDIARSLGERAEVYEYLTRALTARGLTTACSLNAYSAPNWNICFMKRSKLVLKLLGFGDWLPVVFLMDVAQAEFAARERERFAPEVRAALARLGCVRCGKCPEEPRNLREVSGVSVCSAMAYARSLEIDLRTREEADALVEIALWA